MEPPTKRLRLHSSVEVDENNPDFLRKREEGEARFKSTLESIFAKYENMPESRSDEIDMRTGKILVDNGHMRSLGRNRQSQKEAHLLEDLLDGRQKIYEECDEDSADELAPPGLFKSSERKGSEHGMEEEVTEVIPETCAFTTPAQPVEPPLLAIDQSQLLTMLNPALQLNLSQAPSTPSDQQHQSALLLGLGQLVKTAVAEALSHHLGHAFQPVVTPAPGSVVTPATDPKWLFPPLPGQINSPVLPSTDNIPVASAVRTKRPISRHMLRSPTRCNVAKSAPPAPEPQQVESNVLTMSPPTHRPSGVAKETEMEQPIETPTQRRRTTRKYEFSNEDDIYITEMRTRYKWTMVQVRESRPLWKDWPIHALDNHWNLHLKDKAIPIPQNPVVTHEPETELDAGEEVLIKEEELEAPDRPFEDLPVTKKPPGLDEPDMFSSRSSELVDVSYREQLPTPSSLDQAEEIEATGNAPEHEELTNNMMCDQDDLELLSLVDMESSRFDEGPEFGRKEDTVPLKESIIESVEDRSPFKKTLPSISPNLSKVIVQVQIPRKNTRPMQPEPDPLTPQRNERQREETHSTNQSGTNDFTPIVADDCNPTSSSQEMEARARDSSDDLIDGLVFTPVPRMNREPRTLGHIPLLSTPFVPTPKSAPHPRSLHSVGSEATPKLSRAQQNLRIKAQWAKQGRQSISKLKRKSLPELSKRKFHDVDSEDELAF
jgi:hypothetical protein